MQKPAWQTPPPLNMADGIESIECLGTSVRYEYRTAGVFRAA